MMTTQPSWLSALETLVSAGQIDFAPSRRQDHAVDGLVPRVLVYPENAEQVAAILHWAQREKLALLPRGSGTKMQLGGIPTRLDVVLSTSRLSQIHEYDVANFTLTAGAGVQFSQVAELTATHMQTLPLQYSFSTSTVGGLIATNAYNPKRLLYGGVRDLLLGVRVALPSGEIAHFGGRVVKNVAGYDMCKLFLGSLGAFGVIVEATYKLYALPERDATLLAVFPSMSLSAAAVARIMGTQLLPSQVLLLNPPAAREAAPQIASDVAAAGVLLLVNCEGMGETVERQMADISRICQGQGATAVRRYAGETQEEMRRRLGILYPCAMRHITPAPQFLARLGTVPSRVPEVMDAIAHSLGPRISRTLIAGDCGCGLIKLCLPWSSHAADDLDASLVHSLRELPRLVAAERGYMVVESAPTHVKAQLDVWGSPPAALTLMQALKKTFDPEGILSAGRFVGGL